MTENKNRVSLFKNVRDMNVEMVSIERIFQLITSDLHRDSTEKYRYFVSSGLSKDAEAVKRQAAGFVPSAVCRDGRTEKHVVAYTGFAMADFDNMEPNDFQRRLSLFESGPYVLLAYITISRKGLELSIAQTLPTSGFIHLLLQMVTSILRNLSTVHPILNVRISFG